MARTLLERAAEHASTGEYAEAGLLYRRLVGHREAVVHVQALLGLAEASYRTDHEAQAIGLWEQATRAPETGLGWLAWKQLAAARVRADDLRGALAAYREAEHRAPVGERPEIASRLGWLSKELGNAGASQRYFGRARAAGAPAPVVTWAIVATTVAIGLVTLFGGPNANRLLEALALDKDALSRGELYRLISIVLVHGGPLHLAFNMYALFLSGPIVEGLYGRWLFAAAYLLTAATASVASYVVVPDVAAVGASGAIFGLFGMLLVGGRIYRPTMSRRARALTSQIGVLIGFNLILGFGLAGAGVPIDNAAHLGGLVAGGWLGLVLRPRSGATLSAGWSGIGTTPVDSSGQRRDGANLLLRGAALAALVVVIVAGLWIGGFPIGR